MGYGENYHHSTQGDCSRVTDPHVSYASLPKQAVAADQIHAGDCLFTLGKYKEMHEVSDCRLLYKIFFEKFEKKIGNSRTY